VLRNGKPKYPFFIKAVRFRAVLSGDGSDEIGIGGVRMERKRVERVQGESLIGWMQ
jgi:hypothetical protein